MSELPPSGAGEDAAAPDTGQDTGAPLPGWVPILIGVVLVVIASLAVFTGLRYRDQTLVGIVNRQPEQPRTTAHAPPGEPEAGGSLVSAGVPEANEPVEGSARAEVTGGAAGIQSVVRMWARRGMRIEVTPPDAMVYVNNVPVGQARQFDSEDEIYDFAEPGSYTIRLIAPGYKERAFVVTADDAARADVARIQVKMEPLGARR
jgi:hypothetical protein